MTARSMLPATDPVADHIALLDWLAQDCGADGFYIDHKRCEIVAVRWLDGAALPLKRFPVEQVRKLGT